MIQKITSKKQLNRFVFFIKKLYNAHERYVFPIFSALKKELTVQVLQKEAYVALLCLRDDNVVGRLLYTVDDSAKRHEQIGYFSFFDCIDDVTVAEELFSFMQKDLSSRGISYVEGTFSPYDPDTRRGVLVEGFDKPHTIFTSYNFPYYERLLTAVGFEKAYDTYTMSVPLDNQKMRITESFANRMKSGYKVRIDSLNFADVDNDISAVAEIFAAATTEINYRSAPTKAEIAEIFNGMKFFINPELVKIAREATTNKPIGFCFILPDFNQILAKTKGKLRPLTFLLMKNRITSARGILQYVIPEYQHTGVLYLIFSELYTSLEKCKITSLEVGTILEENVASWGVFRKFGGSISKIYRIYGKNI